LWPYRNPLPCEIDPVGEANAACKSISLRVEEVEGCVLETYRMNTIVIGALNAKQHSDRLARCRETWAKDAYEAGIDVVFLYGTDSEMPARRVGDSLCFPVPNDYAALPRRTRAFCEWALAQPGWEYLFKCDSDTYVSIPRLAAYELAGRDYIGAEWKLGVGYGSGGAGYFLSRRAAGVVAARLTQRTGAEDLLVGQVLREAGIPLSIESRFVPWGSMEHRPARSNNLITVHGVGAEVFFAAHAETGLQADANSDGETKLGMPGGIGQGLRNRNAFN
jgi:hypothetical protein